MSLRLTRKERAQARAYRAMLRRVRTRTQRSGGGSPPRTNPLRGRQISAEHKAAIAGLFCVATAVRCGLEIKGVHVAHIRFSKASAGVRNPGLQRKPDDRWTAPLCPNEHRLQHSMNEQAYWAELNVDPHRLAAALWEASPDPQAMLDQLRAEVARARARLAAKATSPTALSAMTSPRRKSTDPDHGS
jgi:hypothetical protein